MCAKEEMRRVKAVTRIENMVEKMEELMAQVAVREVHVC